MSHFSKFALGLALSTLTALASAQDPVQSNLTTGALPSGLIAPFSGTHGLDVTVLGLEDRITESLTVVDITLGGAATASLGARIYEVSTGRLIACTQKTVHASGAPQTVTVPIVATLEAGQDYRLAFNLFTATLPLPTAIMFLPSGLPYTESTGAFRINGLYSAVGDDYPTTSTLAAPHVIVQHRKDAIDSMLVPNPTSVLYSGQGWAHSTRCVDVTVMSETGWKINSVTIDDLNFFSAPANMGIRIYHSATGALLASAESAIAIAPGLGLSVTVPLSTTLAAGESYRIGAYMNSAPGSADFRYFWLGSMSPHLEATGVFRINEGFATSGDNFPTLTNVLLPHTTIHGEPATPGTNENFGIAVGGTINPVLTSCTPARIGHPLRLDVTGGGPGPATLLLSVAPAPVQAPAFGLHILATPILASPTIALSGGKGSLTLPLSIDPGLVGLKLVSQCIVSDATSPAALPLSHSDLLVSEIGG